MTDSTSREGRVTISSAARLSVIEWATVKAVTIFRTLNTAGRKAGR
jgi:hypothetical protein